MFAKNNYNLQICEVNANEMIYFPGHWYHEVHNCTPDTMCIASAASNAYFF